MPFFETSAKKDIGVTEVCVRVCVCLILGVFPETASPTAVLA